MHRAMITACACLISSSAFAWSPPKVGASCKTERGAGAALTRINGNYLGGKQMPTDKSADGLMENGMVDRVSFQACFETEQECTAWLAEKAISHPIKPGFARCTPVFVR